MSGTSSGRSLAGSLAYQSLAGHVVHSQGSIASLQQILWRIGAHPLLVAHARVFGNLSNALSCEVFTPKALYWAGTWRNDINAWVETLQLIERLEPVLRADPVLRDLFKEPRDDRNHPLLGHGVGRHPLAAALFNVHQSEDRDAPGGEAQTAQRFDLVRAHVLAVYCEARARALAGLDAFLTYDGEKEFSAVPIGAGPACLALREFSLLEYAPLLLQFPLAASTPEFAYRMATLQPSYADLPRFLKERAARHFTSLQRYLGALASMLNATHLQPRTRAVEDPGSGPGGSAHRPGWVGYTSGAIKRREERDWEDGAPAITYISLPPPDEQDPLEEEAEGEAPGSTRDEELRLYDPLKAAQILSRMRFLDLLFELQSQGHLWSLEIASRAERVRSLRAAQDSINAYLKGKPTNQSAARLAAVGGILVKACAVYGWKPEVTAAISILRIDRLDAEATASLCYVSRDNICLLVKRVTTEESSWRAIAFLIPEIEPAYRTQLSKKTEAVGRPRQRMFLLPDVGALGAELMAIASRTDRMPNAEPMSRRPLAVEAKTAMGLAKQCLSKAQDTINQDPRAELNVNRLAASVQASIVATSGDVSPAWLITHDTSRRGEARLHYSQIRASRLPLQHLAALAQLDGDRWATSEVQAQELAALQSGWVGCRHVTDIDQLRQVLGVLRSQLTSDLNLSRRSDVRAYHNAFTLRAWLFQALALGLRAGTSGPSVPYLMELRQGIPSPLDKDAIGFADKHNGYEDRARLLPIFDDLVVVANQLEQHNSAVIQRLDLLHEWRALEARGQRLFVIDEREAVTPIQPAWIKAQLAELGLPVPVNFARAVIRTEWVDGGCPGRIADAFLGHFSHGQNWFSRYSSHDPSEFLEQATGQVVRFIERLKLRPLVSRCLPSHLRDIGNGSPVMQLPRNGLKQPIRRQVIKPVWWKTDKAPDLPMDRKELWAEVSRHAAASDRQLVVSLQWLLKNSRNAHAAALVGEADQTGAPLDAASARNLEDEVLMTISQNQLPRTVAASWLRLLLAAELRLRRQGLELVTTQVAALTTNHESPISTSATMRLPDIHEWQAALHQWVRIRAEDPDEDPRFWAIAIGLSAVIHGMVLDIRLLSGIMQFLSEPGPRKLRLCGSQQGFTYMEFELPSAIPGGRQTIRWFLDPLTELLILRAPSFPVTPELKLTSRYIAPFLRHHGTAAHRCANGWRAVIKAARALWSTRVPQTTVQCAQRNISTTSLQTRCWQRLFGSWTLESNRSGALLEHFAHAPSEWLTYEDVTYDRDDCEETEMPPVRDDQPPVQSQWIASGRDIDHVRLDMRSAHLWLHDTDAVLRQDRGEVFDRLQALRTQHPDGSFAAGAIGWLAETAKDLLQAPSAPSSDVLLGLRRVSSTLLPRLAAEMGDSWFGPMPANQRARILGALTHELETSLSRPDLKRGVSLLLKYEQQVAGGGVDVEEDIESDDSDVRVDARILTIDEYLQAVAAIRRGIAPPLRPAERDTLEDLLHFAAWTLARPREYLGARLGDFQLGNGTELDLMIREYTGHGLKTNQATRRVPISLLADTEVCHRIKDKIQTRLRDRLERADVARSELYFAAPEGQDVRVYHDRLLWLLRQVLRRVTGDPGMRVYSLRHAGANWILMALHGDAGPTWSKLWASHPAMLQYLQQGDGLRQRLLGTTDRTDRRAILAITKLQGHLAAATTFMHYLHLTGLLQLQATHRFAAQIPKAVLAAAAGVKPSSFSEQSAAGLFTTLQHARVRAGWTASQPEPPKSIQHKVGDGVSCWLTFTEVQVMLDAHGKHHQPMANIAAHFRCSEEVVLGFIEAAAGTAPYINATVEACTASNAVAVVMPEARMNEAERLRLDHLVGNIEVSWRNDPQLVVDAIGLIFERTSRLHEELTLQDPQQLSVALTFFERCGVAPCDLQFVLRRRDNNAALPEWAAALLGRYVATPTKVLPPDTRSSDAALAKWLRIRLVDRQGQALPKVFARAMFTAWLNISAASADAKHHSTDRISS